MYMYNSWFINKCTTKGYLSVFVTKTDIETLYFGVNIVEMQVQTL